MESVSVELDLRNFIRAARREVSSDAAVVAKEVEAAEAEAGFGGGGFSQGDGPGGVVGTGSVAAATGAGVLLNRADNRATALVFQNLFGVGPVRSRRGTAIFLCTLQISVSMFRSRVSDARVVHGILERCCLSTCSEY